MSVVLDVEWAARLGVVLTDAGVEAMLQQRTHRPVPVCRWLFDNSGRLTCRWSLAPAIGAAGGRH